MASKSLTIANLEKQVLELQNKLQRSEATCDELRASTPFQYHQSSLEIQKLTRDKFLGSGVIVQIHSLGGKLILGPVMIKDGFQPEFVTSFVEHLKHSFESSIEFKVVDYTPGKK